MLVIENDNAEIINTNYYVSELNRAGKFYVSINSGAFRLLIPDIYIETMKKELKLAKKITITRKNLDYGPGFEILLEDFSNDPFILQFAENSFDRIPEKNDENKEFIFSAWIKGNNNKIEKIYEKKCFYTKF